MEGVHTQWVVLSCLQHCSFSDDKGGPIRKRLGFKAPVLAGLYLAFKRCLVYGANLGHSPYVFKERLV